MPARIEVLRRHPLLLLDGCHNPDGAKMLAATLTRADFEENLVGVLGVLADKDYKEMLSDLAPCFAKVYTVTPNCPRALSAEDLQKEARFHMDAEAADNVPDALRKAIDYADENNLAGVVVCGSLYLAAEARPLSSRRQKNNRLPHNSNKICTCEACIITIQAFLYAVGGDFIHPGPQPPTCCNSIKKGTTFHGQSNLHPGQRHPLPPTSAARSTTTPPNRCGGRSMRR